jgi:hypothetical protein
LQVTNHTDKLLEPWEKTMEAKHVKYQRLLDFCKSLPPTPTAVAHPCDESSLRGAVEAGKLGLISPILVGPRARIEALAKQHGIDAGACGNPAILAYANRLAPTDRPDIGYAMIFPGMTIIKILFVDIVPALFSK